ncbi:MAG TPA: M1 family aminopeptidase [Puia sp.]|nr:M1 family aminopeptidase [Puia sp.]
MLLSKITSILLGSLLFIGAPLCGSGQSTTPPAGLPILETGISATLAAQRSAILKDIRYDLQFRIPAQREAPIQAEETLSFTLTGSRPVDHSPHSSDLPAQSSITASAVPLVLDFKEKTSPQQIQVNGIAMPVVHEREHLLIPPVLLHPGPNTIHIIFTAGNSALNRNKDFLYTLLVPDRARTLFPCFDQPDLKAVFTLSLVIPSDWKAMGNALLATSLPGNLKDSLSAGPVPPLSLTSADTRTFHFLPSDKISTYLFSFVAGKFTESDQTVDGRPMHFFYRETDSTKIRMSMDPVFRIQADALQFMKEYTGLAYPFQKFDFVAIPDFQFGGMEHVGAIQYKASALFLDSGATRDQIIARSNVLSHETAHMWFGDLVTMTWFNDVWMKEVFANFMADKISNITLPDGKYDLKFLTDHFPAAYSIDRTAGAHPIRQQLDNLQEAGSLYGNIIYHKAPIMMRQLERLMGADAFRDGLRDYLKRYAGANASWPDLIHQLATHTSVNLEAWNRVWVNELGRPRFSYRLRTAKNKITELEIRQQGEDGSSRTWPQLFEIALVYKEPGAGKKKSSGPGHYRLEELTVNMNDSIVRVPAAVGKSAPLCILFNSSGQGYGLFPIDQHSLAWIFQTTTPRTIPSLAGANANSPAAGAATPLMRASAYINLYENMLGRQVLTPRQLLGLNRRALSQETEELNLNLLTDQIVSIYWRFLSPAARDSLAGGLEKDIWQAMLSAGSANEKKLLFKTYSNIVLSKQGQDRLYAIWKQQVPPAGVKLSEEDYTSLAAALALRAYPGERTMLQEQLSRIQNEDRRQRLIYLLPALSNDIRDRDRFFDSLTVDGGRKKEAWVLTGLSYLHHPLRTAASEKYLPKTLDLLSEIQRTGDVFFPQSWLQTSFTWYRTRTAAAIVRGFLQQHPDYNPKLKAKILQAADNLFRASR